MPDSHDNAVTLLSMTIPLPGGEDEAKVRWIQLLEDLGVENPRPLVLRQMGLWPQAIDAVKAGHTVQSLTAAVEELEEGSANAGE